MPNLKTTSDGKQIIDTGLPQRYIKNIWLELHREINLKIIDAILNSDPTSRKAIRAMKFSISMILDEDAREAIQNKANLLVKEKMETARKVNPNMSNMEEAEVLEDVYITLMADVTDYVDTAFGVSHRLAVGID